MGKRLEFLIIFSHSRFTLEALIKEMGLKCCNIWCRIWSQFLWANSDIKSYFLLDSVSSFVARESIFVDFLPIFAFGTWLDVCYWFGSILDVKPPVHWRAGKEKKFKTLAGIYIEESYLPPTNQPLLWFFKFTLDYFNNSKKFSKLQSSNW